FEESEVVPTDSDGVSSSQVALVTLGTPLQLFGNLSRDERIWLTWRLNEELRRYKPDSDYDPAVKDVVPADQTINEPPTDCSWRCEDLFDEVEFVQRGTIEWGVLGGMLFLNLFWNGIVSVFVLTLWGFGQGPARFSGGWWGLFLFLIPFEV